MDRIKYGKMTPKKMDNFEKELANYAKKYDNPQKIIKIIEGMPKNIFKKSNLRTHVLSYYKHDLPKHVVYIRSKSIKRNGRYDVLTVFDIYNSRKSLARTNKFEKNKISPTQKGIRNIFKNSMVKYPNLIPSISWSAAMFFIPLSSVLLIDTIEGIFEKLKYVSKS